jgi:hypothetical protein
MSGQTTTGAAANASGSREHFARLKQMLREGRLGPGPKQRRYSPAATETSNLSWEEMAELGNQARTSPAPFRRGK